MPHYGWQGPGETRELTLTRVKAPTITEPASSRAEGTEEKTRFFRCTAPGCGRKFKKAMILARHFNTTHDDLMADKDSWRTYSEVVD